MSGADDMGSAGRDFGEVRLDLSTLGILVSSASAI